MRELLSNEDVQAMLNNKSGVTMAKNMPPLGPGALEQSGSAPNAGTQPLRRVRSRPSRMLQPNQQGQVANRPDQERHHLHSLLRDNLLILQRMRKIPPRHKSTRTNSPMMRKAAAAFLRQQRSYRYWAYWGW